MQTVPNTSRKYISAQIKTLTVQYLHTKKYYNIQTYLDRTEHFKELILLTVASHRLFDRSDGSTDACVTHNDSEHSTTAPHTDTQLLALTTAEKQKPSRATNVKVNTKNKGICRRFRTPAILSRVSVTLQDCKSRKISDLLMSALSARAQLDET